MRPRRWSLALTIETEMRGSDQVEEMPPAPLAQVVDAASETAAEAPIEAVAETVAETIAVEAVPRVRTTQEMQAVVEALIFAAEKPVTAEQLAAAALAPMEEVQAALGALVARFAEPGQGLTLAEIGGAYQLRTAAAHGDDVRRLLQVRPQRLTRAALETLSIVAYRQPVTRPEVEDIRGVDCGAVLKALLDRRLLRVLGKKDEPGRPLLYGTSREFLELFHLKDLASLPTLREFHELTEESRQIVEKEAPPEGVEGLASLANATKLDERLAETAAESDAALAALETAMHQAEVNTKAAAETLAPPPPPVDPLAPPPVEP